jgi:hypothetical protein
VRADWRGVEMRTVDVTREFYEKCNELAKQTKIPEVKYRLTRLADEYRRKLDELERRPTGELPRVASQPIAPK